MTYLQLQRQNRKRMYIRAYLNNLITFRELRDFISSL